MALPAFVYMLVTLLKPALMFLGAAFIGLFILIKAGSSLPGVMKNWLRKRLLRTSLQMGNGTQMLIEDSDGILQLRDAEYDAENGGYWAGKQFFSSDGEGGQPMPFYGISVLLAYDGLGAISDLASAEVGKQAKIKKQVDKSDSQSMMDNVRETFRGLVEDDPHAVTDGGGAQDLNEFTAFVPKRAIVDLRDTLHNTPFHVRPAQFDRVEENAKAGQSVGMNENLIRFGLLITGFMLAVIAFVVMGNGGGGASMSLPF